MWVILGVCVCMCDCVVGLFDFCVFICHDCTAAFFMRNKLNINMVSYFVLIDTVSVFDRTLPTKPETVLQPSAVLKIILNNYSFQPIQSYTNAK